jgi:uncharacterized membrane protein YfcA
VQSELTQAAMGLVAFTYAMVGHGGASGYLAVGSLAGLPLAALKGQALLLNLGVSGIAAGLYFRAKFLRWGLFLPLALGSIPAAYVAAQWQTGRSLAEALLALALMASSVRLFFGHLLAQRPSKSAPAWPMLTVVGVGLGLLSGLTGVGGGIYLSPLVLWLGWADMKEAAACSALFIFVNSLAGLAGIASHGPLPSVPPAWLAATLLGGAAGAWLGAEKIPRPSLARVLAAVLLMAALKLGAQALA